MPFWSKLRGSPTRFVAKPRGRRSELLIRTFLGHDGIGAMRARVPVLALAFVLWAHEVGVWAHQPHEEPENAIRIFSIAVVLQKGDALVDASLAFSSAMTPHQVRPCSV